MGAAPLIERLRARGARGARRSDPEREDLRRAIRFVDGRFPDGGNCFRRVLLEVALDPSIGDAAGAHGAAPARRGRERARVARRRQGYAGRLRRCRRRVVAGGSRQAVEAVRHRDVPERERRDECVRFAHVPPPDSGLSAPRNLFASSASVPSMAVSRWRRSACPRRRALSTNQMARSANSGPGAATSARLPQSSSAIEPLASASAAASAQSWARRSPSRTTVGVAAAVSTTKIREISRDPALSKARAVVVLPAPLAPENAVSPSGSRHADACNTVMPRRWTSFGVTART